jgi:ribosomal protein S18 acetylase RimI-like enzyme
MNSEIEIRLAVADDVFGIRELLADDILGRTREDLSEEGLVKYQSAFQAIQESLDNELYVAQLGDRLVGTYQITWIPYLSRGGILRCVIETVRVSSDMRGQGLGSQMMEHAIRRAKLKKCALVQLMTDRTREDAHRFYERLGFEWTHRGLKMKL